MPVYVGFLPLVIALAIMFLAALKRLGKRD